MNHLDSAIINSVVFDFEILNYVHGWDETEVLEQVQFTMENQIEREIITRITDQLHEDVR